MPVSGDKLREFVAFAQGLQGDEKGEANLYVDRLMRAFGHEGSIEAGGTHELRIRAECTTKFADYVWPGRVLIEMKRRGENLAKHYQQAFTYWLELVPNRPAYTILCNFDEIWIYDFNRQLREPVQKIPLAKLAKKEQFQALRFLEPTAAPVLPKFAEDRVRVTKDAADLVANVYNALVEAKGARSGGKISEEIAQRYILQCVVALYSEDAGLLPEDFFEAVLKEAVIQKNAYDVVGGLFRQMNDPRPAAGGRYRGVDYFNGGLFATVEPIDLNFGELTDLIHASKSFDWSMVEPEIFGTLFQKSMGEKARHAYGAHYTSPIDIMKVVTPTIVRPWDRAIERAEGFDALLALRKSLARYRVLDPACGSGNFLYIAYRELKAIERRLLRKMLDADRERTFAGLDAVPFVSTRQFFGLDVLPFAVELAKVTLMLAKELAIMRPEGDDPEVAALVRNVERPLPLDNLDANIRLADALFDPWPEADAIIGNPPYLGSRYIPKELGYPYARKLAEGYPVTPRMADLVAYFFLRAHLHLKEGGRAGLVGTNTIRQNETREASLDYIVKHRGVILEAVSSQVWSGDANVYVSIVNWAKRLEITPLQVAELGEGEPGAGANDRPSGQASSGLLSVEMGRVEASIGSSPFSPIMASPLEGGSAFSRIMASPLGEGRVGVGNVPDRLAQAIREGASLGEPDVQAIGPDGNPVEMGPFAHALHVATSLYAENPLTTEEIAEPKRLYFQTEEKRDAPLDLVEVETIPPTLSEGMDVSGAISLRANAKASVCFQGPTPGAAGFLVDLETAKSLLADKTSADKIHPYLTGGDLVESDGGSPRRYAVDLNAASNVLEAQLSKRAFMHLEQTVLPYVQDKLQEEQKHKGTNEFSRRIERWWKFRRDGSDVFRAIRTMPRYIACSRVTKRPIFEFISSDIHPDTTVQVFAFPDDYSFGILQSGLHFAWFKARCSSLKGDYRYTSDTVFDSFPWPQTPAPKQCRAVADAAIALRALRRRLMAEHSLSYRALYRTLETPGKNPLRDAQDALDRAVRAAYGMPADADPLAFLLALNLACAAKEAAGESATPPGLPAWIEDRETYVTDDCIRPASL